MVRIMQRLSKGMEVVRQGARSRKRPRAHSIKNAKVASGERHAQTADGARRRHPVAVPLARVSMMDFGPEALLAHAETRASSHRPILPYKSRICSLHRFEWRCIAVGSAHLMYKSVQEARRVVAWHRILVTQGHPGEN